MSSRLTDSTGRPLATCYLTVDLTDGQSSTPFIVNVFPAQGYSFVATPEDADVQVMARNGSDAFQDIGASSIDLSGFTPDTARAYDVKAVADSPLTDVRRIVVHLAVVASRPAPWSS